MGFKRCLGAPALMAHEERVLAQTSGPPEPHPQSGGQAACASGRAHPLSHSTSVPGALVCSGSRASSGVSDGQCCLWLAVPRGSWGVLSALHFLCLPCCLGAGGGMMKEVLEMFSWAEHNDHDCGDTHPFKAGCINHSQQGMLGRGRLCSGTGWSLLLPELIRSHSEQASHSLWCRVSSPGKL